MMTRNFRLIAGICAVAVVAVACMVAWRSDPASTVSQEPASQPVSVEVTAVRPGTILETVTSVGTIEAARDVMVSSETGGRVTRVPVNVGDYVRAGQTLVQVDDELKSIAVEQAEAQVLAAETSVRKAGSDYDRATTLRSSGDIADVELEGSRLALRAAEAEQKRAAVALKFAQRQLADTRIKAPISGLVVSKRVEVGEMVGPGHEVANIVDISSLKAKVGVAEEVIGKIRKGQRVALSVDTRPGGSFPGIVRSVGSKTESPTGHTYPVEIVLDKGATDVLKVGMFVRADIEADVAENALVVSKESIVGDMARPAVFVAEEGIARRRPVAIGVRSTDACQIIDGVREGELVISFGQSALKDGTPVRYETTSGRNDTTGKVQP